MKRIHRISSLVAAVAYRAASTWLPVGAGFLAYVVFQLRHARRPIPVVDVEPVPELALT